MIESDVPRDLAIESKDHEFYSKFKDGKVLPDFKGFEMAHLFMIAFSYGVRNDIRISLKKPKKSIYGPFIKNNYGHVITAVAIASSEEGLDIFPDKTKIYKIAEEYANGGIDFIKRQLNEMEPGRFEEEMERILDEIIDDDIKNKS